MARIPTATSEAFTKNAKNGLSLLHSAVDMPADVYDLASWLTDDFFVNSKKSAEQKSEVLLGNRIEFEHPIAFGDYNSDNQCMGIGLKAVKDIPANEPILKVMTQCGMLSNSFFDEEITSETSEQESETEAPDNLAGDLQQNTLRVAKMLAPHNKEIANKFYHHLVLTQKLISARRKESSHMVNDNYVKAFINCMPVTDLTSIIYWD